MRELRPDIVMLNVTYNDTGLIVSQARTLCLGGGAMLGAIGCNAPKFVEMMPDDPAEVYLAALFNQISSALRIQNFIKLYRSMFETEPSEAAALAYDAFNALVNAIELGAGKREEAKDYLRKVEFQGVTNRIRFDENGDVFQSTLSLLKLGTGKKWMEYK